MQTVYIKFGLNVYWTDERLKSWSGQGMPEMLWCSTLSTVTDLHTAWAVQPAQTLPCRRGGWVHRGPWPEMAEALAGQMDVVSVPPCVPPAARLVHI